MTEQVLDLRRSLRAIRRRWMLVVVVSVAGLACGLLVSVLQSPKFVARSAVMLPPARLDAKGDPLRDMRTEVHIASSAEILDRAGRALEPPPGTNSLRRRVRAVALSADILEVRAEAKSARAATLLADSVAKEYVAYANGATSDQADTSITVLEQQAAELDQRIRRLDDEIASNSARLAGQQQGTPEALRQASVIDLLRSAQVDAARQLSSLNTQIAESRLNAELSRRGTRVLGHSQDAKRVTHPLWSIGIGGALGLVAGVVAALALEYRDRRLRDRDDIAAALGAPVVGSMHVPGGGSIGDCAALLKGWAPSAVESVALRQAFDELGVTGTEPSTHVVVVTLAGDRASLLVAAQLAVFAAAMEINTVFVVATQHDTVATLRRACQTEAAPRPHLSAHAAVSDVTGEDLDWADLTVAVVVADSTTTMALPTWGRRKMALVVSSGFAPAQTLASTALSCLDAGHPIQGVLVANPDASDKTTGRLPGVLPAKRGAVKQQDEIRPRARKKVRVP